MNTPTKQTVYLRVPPFKTSKLWVSDKETEQLEFVKEQEAFVFTSEELNEYTANVIKQALETAAEKAVTKDEWWGNTGSEYCNTVVDKQSITNTFKKTYKKFEV